MFFADQILPLARLWMIHLLDQKKNLRTDILISCFYYVDGKKLTKIGRYAKDRFVYKKSSKLDCHVCGSIFLLYTSFLVQY